MGKRVVIFGIALFACAALMQTSIGHAQDQLQIETNNGRLRIDTEAADLQEILQQLAAEGDFKLWISGGFPHQSVKVHIEDATLEDSLRQLLVGNNYALVFDDNAEVSALYLLSPGEHRPVNVELAGATVNFREQVLQNALASQHLPDNVKAAMMSQFSTDRSALQQSAIQLRPQVIEKLIENLEQFGSASPETINRLRQSLERENGLAIE